MQADAGAKRYVLMLNVVNNFGLRFREFIKLTLMPDILVGLLRLTN